MIRRALFGLGAALAFLGLMSFAPAQIGPLFGTGPMPYVAANCTPVTTTLGFNDNTSGTTVALTGVNVPAGSLLVIEVFEFPASSNSTPGTVSDGVNTYTLLTSVLVGGSSANGPLAMFYAPNASLSSGTITYTKHQSSALFTSISAFYAAGMALTSPVDGAVTVTGSGTSNSPSTTSGTPGVSGELFVSAFEVNGTSPTFTQDSGNGWAAPFTEDPTGIMAGGSQVNAGTGTKTYHPTTSGTSMVTGTIIAGFKHC